MHNFFFSWPKNDRKKTLNKIRITIDKLTKRFFLYTDKSVDLTAHRTENQLKSPNELKDSM